MADFDPSVEQQAILAHQPDRHARILAGPGTGKSATLVMWLGNLSDGADPPKLKLLTFTRAATSELAGKVLERHTLTGTVGPIQHDWLQIWMTPALGAAAVLLIFVIYFREPERAPTSVENSNKVLESV